MNSRSISHAAVNAPFVFSEAPAPELPDVMSLTAFASGGLKYRVLVTGGPQWRPHVA